ncbi:uncharacterized protein At4g26450-like isoform X2 [Rutidosis leptorrhynchoides]|uniref:uncharacterized protein At4g26450-like isoform X2 n=1 Tax=Rutidosis leptorrhynchoides TaxID=125765 RepID=UPI003A990EA5
MQRHRNPPNGFRSNHMGIGGGGRGGMAAGGSGYRNFNRGGFGRGQPPPPRRIDVFMEAGKLAAEYLIAKGFIPPNSGNGKWQNSNLKTPVGSSGGSATGSKDGIKVCRTIGSFKDPRVEMIREIEENLSDKKGDGNLVSASTEEQNLGKDDDCEEQKTVLGELESKSCEEGKIDATPNLQSQSPDENEGVKTPVSDVSHQDCVESEEKSVDKNVNTSTTDVVMEDDDREFEKSVVVEEGSSKEKIKDAANNKGSDLLNLIRFNNVPKRTRSSLTPKGSKSDPVLITGDETSNANPNVEPVNVNSLQDDEKQVLIREPKIEEDLVYKFGQGLHARSLSFPQRSSISEQELNEENHGLTRSSSAVLGKRPLQIDDIAESVKKSRDLAPANLQSNDYVHLSQEGKSGISQQCNLYAEEKQFFPSSFKIFDLDTIGVSDVHENHGANPVIGFSSVAQSKQEPVSVDFDLTMNSNCGLANRHMRCGPDGNEVEVIDLDCDSLQNDYNNPERRDEAIFTDLGSFPDSMQRVGDMPQDGYGLTISELLDADIPNSSVSTGVNSIHNEMSLQNEEGILDDDESIYMSLGEIPISMPQL